MMMGKKLCSNRFGELYCLTVKHELKYFVFLLVEWFKSITSKADMQALRIPLNCKHPLQRSRPKEQYSIGTRGCSKFTLEPKTRLFSCCWRRPFQQNDDGQKALLSNRFGELYCLTVKHELQYFVSLSVRSKWLNWKSDFVCHCE